MASCCVDRAVEPFSRRLAVYLRWAAALTLLFLVTYGGTNWLASQRASRLRLYFDWELGIPFVPWMIWVYLSAQAFFTVPLFVLDSNGIRRYGRTFALITVAAAAIHLAFPADLGWPRAESVPNYPIFAGFFALDRPHNLLPSLHVAYSALAFVVIWEAARRTWLKALAAIWLVLLICSVLLIHQHHLADVVSGLALGFACYVSVPWRRCHGGSAYR